MLSFTGVLALLSLVVLLVVLRQPIDGDFTSRQVIVQANIQKLLAGGGLLAPGTFNLQRVPLMYEFPLYQWVVSGVAYVLAADPLVVARLFSSLLFVVALFVFDAVLALARCTKPLRILALLLVASSPLQLHFYSTPMADCLAIVLSLVALLGFLQLELGRNERTARRWLVVMVVAGFAGALIKCTVVLPIAFGVVCHVLVRGGWRGVLNRNAVAFGLACLAGLAAYLWSRSLANGSEAIVNQNAWWLFGTWEEHFELAHWEALGRSLGFNVLAFPMTILAAFALLGFARKPQPIRGGGTWLLLGWAIGGVVYTLVFFHVHWMHSYYQLPLVFPAAFWGASAVLAIFEWLSALGSRRFAMTLVVAFGLLGFGSSARSLAALRAPQALEDQERGAWLQEHTGEHDFIVYVTRSSLDRSDTLSYFAQRDGANLGIELMEGMAPATTLNWVVRFMFPRASSTPERLHVFVAPELVPRVEAVIGGSSLFSQQDRDTGGRLYSLEVGLGETTAASRTTQESTGDLPMASK